MTCYEYTNSAKKIGKLYIYSSVIGIPLTLYFLSDSDIFFAVVANYILLAMFIFLALVGLLYIFFKGNWYFKIDSSHFEYTTPFGKSKCFKILISEIEKLEVQRETNALSEISDTYYLHLKNKQKYQLDTESLASMSKIEKCLKKASIEIEYSTNS